jgi:type IV secretion system protein VirD4
MDIKGELYAATARRRRDMGQKVYVLDMRDGHASDALNPLDLAAFGGESVASARSFAAELIDRPLDEKDPFWTNTSETVLAGGIAWLRDDCKPEECNLGKLYDIWNDSDTDYAIAVALDNKTIKTPSAVAAFGGYLSLPDKETRPCVKGTVQTYLRFLDSPFVRRITDHTTIDIEGLLAGRSISIYIIVPPAKLLAYRPLLRLWISGLVMALTHREQEPEHKTLFLIDELGNLGKIEGLVTAFTLLRSFGVTIWGFLQNPSQLSIYGSHARTILDNAGVISVFGARNRQMAADFAGIVGGDVDTIMDMDRDDQLLLIEGGRPILSRRLKYYADPEFAGLYEDARQERGRR